MATISDLILFVRATWAQLLSMIEGAGLSSALGYASLVLTLISFLALFVELHRRKRVLSSARRQKDISDAQRSPDLQDELDRDRIQHVPVDEIRSVVLTLGVEGPWKDKFSWRVGTVPNAGGAAPKIGGTAYSATRRRSTVVCTQ